ncbi:MAG: hypothetical protein ACI4IR_06885 [Eubacterium sp.]
MKKIISIALVIIGTLIWILGLTVQTPLDNLKYILINLAFLLVGSIFIYLAVKINSASSQKTEINTKKKIPMACYVMDGDMPIEISYPLTDWDRCYLIAWQEKEKEKNNVCEN